MWIAAGLLILSIALYGLAAAFRNHRLVQPADSASQSAFNTQIVSISL
jgi:hypothetical protein